MGKKREQLVHLEDIFDENELESLLCPEQFCGGALSVLWLVDYDDTPELLFCKKCHVAWEVAEMPRQYKARRFTAADYGEYDMEKYWG